MDSEQKRMRRLGELSLATQPEDVDALWSVEKQMDDREHEILQAVLRDDGDLLRMEWDVDLATTAEAVREDSSGIPSLIGRRERK